MEKESEDLIIKKDIEKEWRGGVYMCTARNSFEADIFESKLSGEEIPCLKRYEGAGNFNEVIMGTNSTYGIDIYVPPAALEDARNIVKAIPLVSDNPEGLEDETED